MLWSMFSSFLEKKTTGGQTSVRWHIFYRGKPLGKAVSSWSHLSLHNLLRYSLYLPFLPLGHSTLPISSLYHSVPLSIILLLFYALCPSLSCYLFSISPSLSTFFSHPLLYRLFCHPPLLCYVLLCLYIYREMVKCSKIGCFDADCVIQNRLISTI